MSKPKGPAKGGKHLNLKEVNVNYLNSFTVKTGVAASFLVDILLDKKRTSHNPYDILG